MKDENDRFYSYNYLQFATGIMIGKYFWTTAVNFNGLYCVDLENGTSKEIAVFTEDLLGMELYTSKIINIGSKLYIIPGRASAIAVFDMSNSSLIYIPIENELDTVGCKFGEAILYEKYIYLFPQCLQIEKIIKINIETNNISYCSFSRQEINGNEGFVDIFMYGVRHNDIAWLGLGNKKAIVKFDFTTEKLQIYNIKSANSSIREVVIFKNNLYLLTSNNQVIKFNPNTKEEKIIFQKEEKSITYGRIKSMEGYLWLLPSTANNIVQINPTNLKYTILKLPSNLKKWKRWNSYRTKISDILILHDKIYLLPAGIDSVVILNRSDLTLTCQSITIEDKKRKQLQEMYITEILENNSGLIDESVVDLETYLKYVSIYKRYEQESLQDLVGTKIYNILGEKNENIYHRRSGIFRKSFGGGHAS